MEPVTYQPIGIVHSPHTNLSGMPIQPPAAKSFTATLEVLPEFSDGLTGIEEFTRVILIYQLHKSEGFSLTATPFLDTTAHGVFATRVPRRPNQIGLSTVKLLGRKDPVNQILNRVNLLYYTFHQSVSNTHIYHGIYPIE